MSNKVYLVGRRGNRTDRERFGQVVVELPDEVFSIIHEEVQAALLAQAILN